MRHARKDDTLSLLSIFPRFMMIFIPVVLLLLIGSLILYSVESNALKKIIMNQEAAGINKQESLIKSDFRAIVSDLLYLSTQVGSHSRLKNRKTIVAPTLVSEFLEFARYKGIYDQVRLLDLSGMELIRINYHSGRPKIVSKDQLQNKGRRYYFADTVHLERGEVFVSPFDLNIEKGQIEKPLKPMIRFGTPVFSEDGVKLGVVLLNYLGSNLNNKLREIVTAVSGSNMLLNSNGYWVISPNRQEEWGFMYPDGKERSFRVRHPAVWGRMQEKITGQLFFSGTLYTYNTIFPLKEDVRSSTGSSTAFAPSAQPILASDYYWVLVSVVPEQFFQDEIEPFVSRLTFVNVVLLLLLSGGCWLVASARNRLDQVLIEKQVLIDDLQEALANIRTLSGLIPICASCKSIRDDKGYWKKIERYIGEHSDAEFSHGICPSCAQDLYPELYSEEE